MLLDNMNTENLFKLFCKHAYLDKSNVVLKYVYPEYRIRYNIFLERKFFRKLRDS